MNDTDLHHALTAAYDHVDLPDTVDTVVRRGNQVRRARRAGRAAVVALTGLAAAGLAIAATAPQDATSGVRLAAYSMPSLPVSLAPVPDDLAVSFDYDSGRLIAFYASALGTRDAELALRAGRQAAEDDDATSERRVAVQGQSGRLYVRDLPGDADDQALVTWQSAPGTWAALTGRGLYAAPAALLEQAANVTDRPLPLQMDIDVAPEGWELVGYKSLGAGGSVLAMTDDGQTGAQARRLTVAYQPQAYRPIDPARMEDAGPISAVSIAGQAGQLMDGTRGWYATWPSASGGHFVLQAPQDLNGEQVVAMADGIRLTGPARR